MKVNHCVSSSSLSLNIAQMNHCETISLILIIFFFTYLFVYMLGQEVEHSRKLNDTISSFMDKCEYYLPHK